MRTLTRAICVMCALAAGPAAAQARRAPGEPLPRAQLEAFVDGVIRQAMDTSHIAGVTVAIVQGGDTVVKKGYGFADLERGQRVDPDRTLFRIGSITKTFTWIAMMNAVAAGRLRLDDPVNQHLPADLQIPDEGFTQPIRVHHLMAHSAGFEDLVLGHLFERDASQVRPLRQYLREERPRRVREPGTITTYSNYGVGLAGAILEHVHGRPWQEIVEAEIITPLGLMRTTTREPYPARNGLPAPLASALAQDLAKGYRWTGAGHQLRDYEFITFGAPAGVMSSTAADMSVYMRMLLQDGSLNGARVFGPEGAKAFRTPMSSFPPEVGNWNAGFWETQLPGGFRSYGHDGATLSIFSTMAVVPDLRLGIFIATNTEGGGLLASLLPSRIVEHFYVDAAAVPPKGSPALAAAAGEYEGTYIPTRRAYGSLEGFLLRLVRPVRVAVTPDGYLLFPLDGPRRFIPARDADTFQSVDGLPLGLVVRREDGRVVRIDTLAMAFERVGLLEQPIVLALMFIATVITSAGTLWRTRGPFPLPRRVQIAAAVAWLLSAISAIVFIVTIVGDPVQIVFTWPSTPFTLFSVFALVASVLSAIALAFVPLVRTVRFALVTLLFAATGGMLAVWGALAPWS